MGTWIAAGPRPQRTLAFACALVGVSALLVLAFTLASQREGVLAPAPGDVTAAEQRSIERGFSKLPVAFVPNRGQVDARANYYARGSGYGFYFTESKVVLALAKGERTQVLDLAFVGANRDPQITSGRPTGATVNELGAGPRQAGLSSHARITYRDLWPGIDMVFFGAKGKLNYEFRLAPGADPGDIRLAYRGAEGVSLASGGHLVLDTELGALTDSRPRTYQRIRGDRRPVRSGYALREGNSFGFRLGAYDSARPLVIDPALDYSTYLGGSSTDSGHAIAVDAAGSAYVTGYTSSLGMPTTPGAYDDDRDGFSDAFVAKLTPDGSALAYATYLGGFNGDQGNAIAVDATGNAYVMGKTGGFPVTQGAFDTTFNGGDSDAFVAKLSPSGGALEYATYLGGSSNESDYGGIAIDEGGSVYVTGYTLSANFPTTQGAFDTTFNSGTTDAFVAKLSPSGGVLDYSTYLGGTGNELGLGIAVDDGGNAHVTGQGDSADFPTTPGAFDTTSNNYDAFVTKVAPDGTALAYSTYLGGSSGDFGLGIAVDGSGSAYVTGDTLSADFPTSPGAFDRSSNGSFDGFVAKLSASGAGLTYSTYLGGSGEDISYGIAAR